MDFGTVSFVLLVEMGKNTVFAVTVCAVGSVGVLVEVGLPVSALEVVLGDLGMTV
jgi:hypothetical protein